MSREKAEPCERCGSPVVVESENGKPVWMEITCYCEAQNRLRYAGCTPRRVHDAERCRQIREDRYA